MYFFLTGGEDLEAFIEVRLQLIAQYMPIGPDEEDSGADHGQVHLAKTASPTISLCAGDGCQV